MEDRSALDADSTLSQDAMPIQSSESSTSNVSTQGLAGAAIAMFLRQLRFPSFLRGVTEALIFCCVFLAAGYVSLGHSVSAMLVPMVPVVFIMMISMVMSGVYRQEITHSIVNLYIHTVYGFLIGSLIFVLTAKWIVPDYANFKFEFFFLFFAFFVTNTIRPLISGTDFMDGGGRRTN